MLSLAALLICFLVGINGACGGIFPKFGINAHLKRFTAAVKPTLPLLPPLLLFILSTSEVETSPLNAKRIKATGPFFQGWLVRVIDHEQSLSAITIVGSFSRRWARTHTQHYVFCAIDSPSMKEHAEMFVYPGDVKIGKVGAPHQTVDIAWTSREGGFTFNDSHCSGQFTFADKFSIAFDTTNQMKWSPKNNALSFGGPEGWVGLMSPLMPCHYFVHSVGSRCSYRIRKLNPITSQPDMSSTDVLTSGVEAAEDVCDERELSGTGFAHIECNYGTAFPIGWTWSQGIAVNNTASYSLALGKFTIAGMTPTNCILYLRRTNNETVVVRTTDFDSANYTTNATDGTLHLTAHSVLKRFHIEMTVQSPSRVDSAFNVTVHVPTVNGFSKSPGCKETYTAVTHIKFTDLSTKGDKSEEYSFPLSALEYGGSFLEKITQ